MRDRPIRIPAVAVPSGHHANICSVLNGNDKGLIAETEIQLAAIRAGVPVLLAREHCRYDLAFDVGGRIWRVQCKWGRLNDAGDVAVVNLGRHRYTSRGVVFATYTEDEVDLFGIYCGALDRSFLLPAVIAAGKSAIHLRVRAPRNSQSACINLADDFDFEGAVAQLGERRRGTPKATGSSPVSSTPPSPGTQVVGANAFRDRFGLWMEQAAAGTELLITRHGRPMVRIVPAR